MAKLSDVRCPFDKKGNDGKIYSCNKLVIRVYPGSSGEAYCSVCKLTFDFEVDDQSTYKPSVRVKHEY